MKHWIFTVMITVLTISGFAQQRDPKAKAILDQVSAKFKTYKSVTANFGYQIMNNAGKVMANKKGVIKMKGDSYVINLGGNKIISDGTTIWNYDPAAQEVTVNSVETKESTITPQKLFTDFYNKDFMYILGKDEKVGGKMTSKIILQPIDKSKPFSRVYLAVDKASMNIISTMIVEKTGNRYVYSVSDFKPNTTIADGEFNFDKSKFPGVEVVDLR
ncbi:MAG TPA: outer membrane lipoprotein carrier protein LolA [Niabella sp.]|nr:outer membrane lipoprotein carrier protein LolA [Niabella sp.]HOZ98013.1 outer membrane lipoprotein carrier protein LolA [Niabella sp.]HQW14842.1 outer membrane lipoprotein carrier protein LolA [Niabella sp.]HQX18533.1 outer membrane lipoprotein carrier protein LolA [Niabella sp.]HQX40753.1 outer membrane lipoprotein carrier protein LolA [Niabella sp.]